MESPPPTHLLGQANNGISRGWIQWHCVQWFLEHGPGGTDAPDHFKYDGGLDGGPLGFTGYKGSGGPIDMV